MDFLDLGLKACGAALGQSRETCFEELAGVFANSGAMFMTDSISDQQI